MVGGSCSKFQRPQQENKESCNEYPSQSTTLGTLPIEALWCVRRYLPVDVLMRWRRISLDWRFLHKEAYSANASDQLPPAGETLPVLSNISPIRRNKFSSPLFYLHCEDLWKVKSFNKTRVAWEELQLDLGKAEGSETVILLPSAERREPTSAHLEVKNQFMHIWTCGGLFVYLRTLLDPGEEANDILIVTNPATALQRQLPPVPEKNVDPVGITVSKDQKQYAVVVAACTEREKGHNVYVYESGTGSWHNGGILPVKFAPTLLYSSVSVRGTIYFLTHQNESARYSESAKRNPRVCAYCSISRRWQEVEKLPKYTGAGRPYLVENEGNVLFVVRVKLLNCTSWKFYKLDPLTLKWDDARERGRSMPSNVYDDLSRRGNQNSITVSGGGYFIYFFVKGFKYRPDPPMSEACQVLAHNTRSRTWEWLSETLLRGVSEKLVQGHPVVLPLQPSFTPV